MFERYTEKARRVIFFARREASEFGSPTIESEHILLGLVQESKDFLKRYLGDKTSEAELRAEVLTYTLLRAPTSTSVDIPLSEECKQILMFGAEEAERLGHRHIGTEHLMLGILRTENSVAARVFRQHGLRFRAGAHHAGRGRPGNRPKAWNRYRQYHQLPAAPHHVNSCSGGGDLGVSP